MIRTIKLTNKNGLHARPSVALAQKAMQFTDTSITVSANGKKANGKSPLDLLTLCATCGTMLTIEAEGDRETQALDEIEDLFHLEFNVHYD
jgi:phosphocarrier protein NPr